MTLPKPRLGAIVVLAFACFGCTSGHISPRAKTTVVPASTSTAGTGRPSQSSADARRDGVVPAVAALTFTERVSVQQAVASARGVWVVSRLPVSTSGDPASGSIGPAGGIYGKSRIAAAEYGEVLLLDHTRDHILRAFPLPGLPPDRILVRPSAVFCERQGDGALPDSMLCRIDPRSYRWRVRVFPNTTESAFHPASLDRYIPRNWTINAPDGRPMFTRIHWSNGHLVVEGNGYSATIDAATLRIE